MRKICLFPEPCRDVCCLLADPAVKITSDQEAEQAETTWANSRAARLILCRLLAEAKPRNRSDLPSPARLTSSGVQITSHFAGDIGLRWQRLPPSPSSQAARHRKGHRLSIGPMHAIWQLKQLRAVPGLSTSDGQNIERQKSRSSLTW